MTGKISDFGSLADRVAGRSPAPPSTPSPSGPGGEVRHAWLDGSVPVLVARWRRSETGWEGLVVGVTDFGTAAEWVIASRLQAATG